MAVVPRMVDEVKNPPEAEVTVMSLLAMLARHGMGLVGVRKGWKVHDWRAED
jgi:hypothetical protein